GTSTRSRAPTRWWPKSAPSRIRAVRADDRPSWSRSRRGGLQAARAARPRRPPEHVRTRHGLVPQRSLRRDDAGQSLPDQGARSGRPPTLLRSRDGMRFEAVGTLGSDPAITSYRTLVPFGDRLYAAPTGRVGGAANAPGQAVLTTTRLPSANRWKSASSAPLGEASDLGVFECAALDGALYATTLNPQRGFALWRSRPAGRPPHEWTRVLADGRE